MKSLAHKYRLQEMQNMPAKIIRVTFSEQLSVQDHMPHELLQALSQRSYVLFHLLSGNEFYSGHLTLMKRWSL